MKKNLAVFGFEISTFSKTYVCRIFKDQDLRVFLWSSFLVLKILNFNFFFNFLRLSQIIFKLLGTFFEIMPWKLVLVKKMPNCKTCQKLDAKEVFNPLNIILWKRQ